MTPEPVAFPDVEELLVGWAATIVAVPVHTRVPNPRPDEWVRVLRTGGPRVGLVTDQAQVTWECWALDSVTAAETARVLRAHVGALGGRMVAGVQVHRVQELSGPGTLPDPTSGAARVTWSTLIDLRGHPL